MQKAKGRESLEFCGIEVVLFGNGHIHRFLMRFIQLHADIAFIHTTIDKTAQIFNKLWPDSFSFSFLLIRINWHKSLCHQKGIFFRLWSANDLIGHAV